MLIAYLILTLLVAVAYGYIEGFAIQSEDAFLVFLSVILWPITIAICFGQYLSKYR